MLKKKDDIVVSAVERSKPNAKSVRIQTAEGWKRAQAKKRGSQKKLSSSSS